MFYLSLTYSVTSSIRLGAVEKIYHGGVLIEFMPDEDGKISSLKIRVPATPEKLSLDPDIPTGRQMPDVMRPFVDRRACEQIEHYALSIEALAEAFLGRFALNLALYKMEWTADTEEEMRSFRGPCVIQARYAERTEQVVEGNPAGLRRLIADTALFGDLVVPLIFLNQGFRDMSEHRLIAAYYNFFFVLEILFAPGYSSPSKVKQSFLRSTELKEAVAIVRKTYAADVLTEIMLKRLLESAQCEVTTEGILEFLIKMRGRLHHVNSPNSPHHWLPVHAQRFTHEVNLIAKVAWHVIEIESRKRRGSQGKAPPRDK